MSLECLDMLLGAIGSDLTDLEKPIAVAGSELSSIIVKLDIVDVVLVLRFQSKNFLRLGGNRPGFRVICHL